MKKRVCHERQPWLRRADLYSLNTIRKLHALRQMMREQGASCEVEIDGGINAETAPVVVAAGAEVLVAGSAVLNRKASVAESITALRQSCLHLVQSGDLAK